MPPKQMISPAISRSKFRVMSHTSLNISISAESSPLFRGAAGEISHFLAKGCRICQKLSDIILHDTVEFVNKLRQIWRTIHKAEQGRQM